ncbi:Transcription initiation factor TFIID subunit 7 [Glycine max]|nr:Transcription initiation factor TFIID subunit 7 [Glycine max]
MESYILLFSLFTQPIPISEIGRNIHLKVTSRALIFATITNPNQLTDLSFSRLWSQVAAAGRSYNLNATSIMEEQFILRVPPNVAERIERLLNENNASSSEDKSLDLSFREDGRSGTFMIGNEQFPASLLDLPCVVESYKTYDDNSLIKTADIGQMIMVRESGDAAPDVIEYRHGLTPPMRDARKRRFRREPDLNPELVSRVEKDLLKIMAGGTADNLDILTSFCPPDSGNKLNFGYFLDRNSHVETAEQEEGDENARGANKKSAPKPAPKHDIPENLTNAGEADRSDSEESDDSV